MPAQPLDSAVASRRGRGVRRPPTDNRDPRAGYRSAPHAHQARGGASALRNSAQKAGDTDEDDDEQDSDSDGQSGNGSESSSGSDSGSGGGSNSGSEDGDAEQAELDRLREGVKDVPFEVVQKLGALGSSRAADNAESAARRPRGPAHVKRPNKNAPQEVSSKIRVGIIPAHVRAAARERKGRDPRFDRLSGKLSEDLFEKSYSWMKDVAQRDAKELRDFASKEKDADARADFLLQASQIEQKLKQDAKKSEETQLKRARKKAMADVVSSTGQAFWLKKRELRQIEIARKYETLKAKGQGAVDDYGEHLSRISVFFYPHAASAKFSHCPIRFCHLTPVFSREEAQAHGAEGPPLHSARAESRRLRCSTQPTRGINLDCCNRSCTRSLSPWRQLQLRKKCPSTSTRSLTPFTFIRE
jgi:ribosomal RNA-processing protein 36